MKNLFFLGIALSVAHSASAALVVRHPVANKLVPVVVATKKCTAVQSPISIPALRAKIATLQEKTPAEALQVQSVIKRLTPLFERETLIDPVHYRDITDFQQKIDRLNAIATSAAQTTLPLKALISLEQLVKASVSQRIEGMVDQEGKRAQNLMGLKKAADQASYPAKVTHQEVDDFIAKIVAASKQIEQAGIEQFGVNFSIK